MNLNHFGSPEKGTDKGARRGGWNLSRLMGDLKKAMKGASKGEELEKVDQARDALEEEVGKGVEELKDFSESCAVKYRQALDQARSLLEESRRLKPADACSERSDYENAAESVDLVSYSAKGVPSGTLTVQAAGPSREGEARVGETGHEARESSHEIVDPERPVVLGPESRPTEEGTPNSGVKNPVPQTPRGSSRPPDKTDAPVHTQARGGLNMNSTTRLPSRTNSIASSKADSVNRIFEASARREREQQELKEREVELALQQERQRARKQLEQEQVEQERQLEEEQRRLEQQIKEQQLEEQERQQQLELQQQQQQQLELQRQVEELEQ